MKSTKIIGGKLFSIFFEIIHIPHCIICSIMLFRSAYTKDDEINACSQKSVISQILFDIDFNELGYE